MFKSYFLPESWNRKSGVNRIWCRNNRSQILWAFICYKISRKNHNSFLRADECPIIVYHKFYCILSVYKLDSSSRIAYMLNYIITLLLSLIVIVTAVHTAYNKKRNPYRYLRYPGLSISSIYYIHIVSEVHTHTCGNTVCNL